MGHASPLPCPLLVVLMSSTLAELGDAPMPAEIDVADPSDVR